MIGIIGIMVDDDGGGEDDNDKDDDEDDDEANPRGATDGGIAGEVQMKTSSKLPAASSAPWYSILKPTRTS